MANRNTPLPVTAAVATSPTTPPVATNTNTTGKHTIDPAAAAAKPDDGAAALTRAQYQFYLDKGRPAEVAALKDIRDPKLGTRMANYAEKGVVKTFKDLAGMEERAVSPFGVKLTPSQSKVIRRRTGLDKALTTVAARNTAMNGTEDMQLNTAGDALNIGRGLAGQAAQTLGGAGANANAVHQANKQASSARTAGAIGGAISMGVTGFMAGGPIGGAVGAGVGLIMGLI